MPCTQPETIQSAQRPHWCSWCAERIETGGSYVRYRFFNDGEAGTVKMHPECHAAMLAVASEEGGDLEWLPGEFERPKPIPAQASA